MMNRVALIAGAALLFSAGTAAAAAPTSKSAPPPPGHHTTLSEQLAQSNGTIRPPPGTDRGIEIAPKHTGKMPVITPREKNGPGVVAK